VIEAVTYLRCSGESQSLGDTWERQSETCQKYAAHNGVEIVCQFRDEGLTGKTELENRDGLSACMTYVRQHGIGLVLVEDQTRLARDLIVSEVCIREFQKIGVRVVAASGGVDLTEGDDSNPTAKLIRQILAAVSEFERCVIVLKLSRARKRIRDEFGKCDGKKAFGEKDGEAPILERMQTLHSLGMSSLTIAGVFNEQGIPSRSGRPWRSTTIAKILARHRHRAKAA